MVMKQRRILIVDENQLVRSAIASYLANTLACQVVAVPGSRTAVLAAITEIVPDLVVLDPHRPADDGLGLLHAIKVQHPALPVVVVSFVTDLVCSETAVRAGALAFIDKLQAPARLLSVVREVFRPPASGGVLPEVSTELVGVVHGNGGCRPTLAA